MALIGLGTWCLFAVAPSGALCQSCPSAQISHLLDNGGYVITSKAQIIEQCNAHQRFIPASTIKTVSALIALTIMQPDYRFATDFFYQNHVLTIKGYGDPLLTSEEVLLIVKKLQEKGLQTVSEIVLDQSQYQVVEPPDGSQQSNNPYDTKNGALAVNFNSLPIVVSASGVIHSAEPQTPLLPIMSEIGSQLEHGSSRVNVFAYPPSKPLGNGLRTVAELFIAIMNQQGIETSMNYSQGRVRPDSTPFYTHLSTRNLEEVVTACLQYSNNFIANQLFLQVGVELFSPPASWSKGRQSVATVLADYFNLELGQNRIFEGSGISRKTRVSPHFLIEVLNHFKPYAHTLEKKDRALIKSGTMQDVYSYAGYFTDGVSLDPFVILLNQEENNRDAILALLAQRYWAYRQQIRSSQP